MKSDIKIGFIGAGRMASAIAGGMIKHNFATGNIMAYDCSEVAGVSFAAAAGGAELAVDAQALVKAADVILLAVKPQYLTEALYGLSGLKDKLIISIVAGVTLEKLGSLTGAARIVRVMPNTPALLGEGCGGYALSPSVTEDDMEIVKNILISIGDFYALDENMLDAVTAVSGCGPAYVYELIQAMADGGVTLGLPRNLAQKLAAATVRGAASMVLAGGTHPIELRDQVCSPGGATVCGVNKLAAHGFSNAVIEAELAAYNRSVELGKK